MSQNQAEDISDIDRDSLHVLPLASLPIATPALRHARMIKNVRLHSVVELFSDADAGSGQMQVEDLAKEFGWDPSEPPGDLIMLRKLSGLASYDVYSLRINLREMGIPVDDEACLQLSTAMNQELTRYMTKFTRPLIEQIYGGDDVEVQGFNDVVKLFRDPDVGKALEKIHIMSEKLEIRPDEIPKFMEDYGDIFLSLSYYRKCLHSIKPIITDFLESVDELRNNYQFKQDLKLVNSIRTIEYDIVDHVNAVAGRFKSFEHDTLRMWEDISAKRFREVEQEISGHQTIIGGVLCALSVKMDAWARLFPNKFSGGPGRRAEFIMSEMKQGMDRIHGLEDEAPLLAATG